MSMEDFVKRFAQCVGTAMCLLINTLGARSAVRLKSNEEK